MDELERPPEDVPDDQKWSEDQIVLSNEHSLMIKEYLNIFNLKCMAFLICRGVYHKKCEMLYAFLWEDKDAFERKIFIPWTQKNLKEFLVKVFYYSDMYPRKFHYQFKNELKPISYRWRTGIRSIGVDKTFSMKSKYCDTEKFQFAMDHLFNEEFLEVMFEKKS